MKIEELKHILLENGIVGAGGAGFPTYAKVTEQVETIIVNCAECEPLLKVHRQMLKKYAYEICKTLQLLQETMGAKRVYISLKKSYVETILALKAELELYPDMQLHLLEEVYPVGDEVVLIYETTGKVVSPGSIPIEHGIVVFNVETVFNIYEAVYNDTPVIYKYLTIAGEVKQPVTVKVPIGTMIQDVVSLAGGCSIENPAYISGGPMTGKLVNEYDVVTKTTNAILVLPEQHYVIQKKKRNPVLDMKKAMASCCQCEMCTQLCPRNLLGHPIEPHSFMRSATSGTTKDVKPFLNTMFCVSCGLCDLYACGQDLSPRTLMDEYKEKLMKKGVKKPTEVGFEEVSPLRKYRLVPMKRLLTRLDLDKYNVGAPFGNTEEVHTGKITKILLQQHIGQSAKPCVQPKQQVFIGQKIGEAIEGKLSVPIHASVSGTVLDVTDRFIRIAKN